MAVTAKKLFAPAQLTASAATYYIVPANTSCLIKKITATNNDTVARTVTIYLVPSGGSAGVTNIIMKTKAIAAAETYEFTEIEGHVISTGDTIQALADSASQVTFQGSGVEIQ